MSGPLLHIGFPKTGTTWFAMEYYNKIKNGTIIHPGDFLSQILEADFNPPTPEHGKKQIFIHPELTGLKKFVWEKGNRGANIANALYKHFPDGKVILFLRNQMEFMTSAYIYYVKKGGTYSSEKMADMIINNKLKFSLNFLKYDEIIELYWSVFGKENVDIYLYEDFCQNPRGFITNYTKRYNFEIDLNEIDFSPRNKKISRSLLNFLLFTNRFTKYNNPFKKYIADVPYVYNIFNEHIDFWNKLIISRKRINTTELFNAIQINYIKDYFRESNSNLIRTYNLKDINKYDYPVL